MLRRVTELRKNLSATKETFNALNQKRSRLPQTGTARQQAAREADQASAIDLGGAAEYRMLLDADVAAFNTDGKALLRDTTISSAAQGLSHKLRSRTQLELPDELRPARKNLPSWAKRIDEGIQAIKGDRASFVSTLEGIVRGRRRIAYRWSKLRTTAHRLKGDAQGNQTVIEGRRAALAREVDHVRTHLNRLDVALGTTPPAVESGILGVSLEAARANGQWHRAKNIPRSAQGRSRRRPSAIASTTLTPPLKRCTRAALKRADGVVLNPPL